MNIENMNREELITAFFAIEKKLGWFSVATLCVDDVKMHIEQSGEAMPSDEDIFLACRSVADNAQAEIDCYIEWAAERALGE